MPVVLLAAGMGTRLKPLTDHMPKCLVPIHGRPLLAYWLELCAREHCAPILVNTHHLEDAVIDFVRRSPWKERVLLVHEDRLLGTGGTLLALRGRLESGAFMVAHADNLSFFPMSGFLAAHASRPRECLLTMMLFRTPAPHACGIVRTDARGVVTDFYEKQARPPGDMANGAVYIMQPEVFPLLEACGKEQPDISLDLIPQCLGRTATFFNADYHRDIGTLESYAMAQRDMLARFTGGKAA
jgi:mannose-1-phosphate guanylyltransferase